MLLFSIIAFLGGILSLLSPCSGVLLPAYFAFVFNKRNKLLFHTFLFSIGVLLITIPIGIGVPIVFQILRSIGPVFFKLIGIIFIIFSLLTLFDIHIFKLSDNDLGLNSSAFYTSSILFGGVSAVSIGTCTGPILGAIATLAASTNRISYSIYLMFLYSLGILFPFILLSFSAERFAFLKKVFVKGKLFKISMPFSSIKIFIHSTNIISSVILLFVGLIFLIFNGSLLNFENLLNINTDYLIDLQDSLLNLNY